MNAKQYAEKRQELLNEMYAELNSTPAPTPLYETQNSETGEITLHYAKGALSTYMDNGDKIAEQYGPRFDALRTEYKQSKNRK